MAIDKTKIQKSAEKLIASGKVAPAIEEYLKILKENPKDWNLWIVVAELYLKVNKTNEAIQAFQKVADHYNADGFFLKAIALYKRVNKLDPNLTEVCMKLADLYLKQGLTMDAKTQLQAVAQHYMSKNQTREAIQTLKKLIDIEPDNLRSRNELAKAYKNEGMLAEAIQEYLEISDELIRKNLFKESLTVLETAFKMDSRNTAILRKILTVYTEQNETGKAMAMLDDALKNDPTNSHLLALMADTYANKNQFDRAHQTIDQAILNTTDKEPFWKSKGDLFLKEGDLIQAFEQYEHVVERLARRKEYEKALELLQKITKVDAAFHPALQKMLEFHTALRQESNVAATYNSLVDAYISKTMYPEAAECLEKLIELEEDNAQHQEKLEFVRSFLDKAAPAPAHRKMKTPAPPPPPPVPEPPPAPEPEQDFVGEDFELDINLDMGPESAPAPEPAAAAPPAVDPDLTPLPKHPPAPPPRPAPPSPPAAPAAGAEDTEEEKEFVSEHLIEAEVFTKYGLIDKAIEQLHIITNRYPNSVLVHQKLKEIYLEKGDRDRAVEECVLMSRIFRKQGDLDQAEDLLSEARQINPNHPSLDRAYKEMPAAAVAAAPVLEPPPAPAPPAPAPKPPAPPPAPPVMPAPAAAPARPVTKPLTGSVSTSRKDVMGEIEKLAMGVKSRPAAKTAPKPVPPPAPPPPPPPVIVTAPKEIVAEFTEPVAEAEPGGALPADRFEEIDFYTSQGLMSEAHRLLVDLKDKHPDDPGVLSRLSQFEEVPVSREELSVDVPVEEPAPVEEAVSSLDLLNAVVTETAPAEEIPEMGEETPVSFMGPAPESLAEPPVEVPDLISEEPTMEETPVAEAVVEEAPVELLPPVEAVEEPVAPPVPEMEELSIEGLELPVIEEAGAQASVAVEPAPEEAISPDLGEPQVVEAEEPPAPVEAVLAQAMDLSDFGELSVPGESLSDAPTEPGIQVPVVEENPFEGKVTEEPPSESQLSRPVEFGEAVEIAENVVEPSPVVEKAEELEFPAERSLDDALDAAFQEDEGPAEESKAVLASPDLFEEEEDFFDLAAELEEGFLNVQNAVEEERPADGQNYSIEEILTDFKKGVEKQLGAEDYDTRYNLGIAYKEMGLVDEAIAEFQIASKDEKRFLECCSMLGLCFLEKGMPKLALKWYQRGLETKGYSEEEYLGLRFEMANAYEATGEEDKALECYQDVYGANASYRNVSKKIKELQQQLKNK